MPLFVADIRYDIEYALFVVVVSFSIQGPCVVFLGIITINDT